jgi:phosphate transport system permease protein
MLGFGRALGETMTVLMATGNSTAMPSHFFDPIRTITATVAIEMGEVPFGTPHFYSLFACALVLFLITLGINMAAERVAAGLRSKGQ